VRKVSPGNRLLVLITKSDLVSEKEWKEVFEYSRSTLDKEIKHRKLSLLHCSTNNGGGVDELVDYLAKIVFSHQKEALAHELKSWQRTLKEMLRLFDNEVLHEFPLDVVDATRDKVKNVFFEELIRLQEGFERDAEDVIREISSLIPASENKLTRRYNKAFLKKFQTRIQSLASYSLNELVDDIFAENFKEEISKGRLEDKGYASSFKLLTGFYFSILGGGIESFYEPVKDVFNSGGIYLTALKGLVGGGEKITSMNLLRDIISRPTISKANVKLKEANEDIERHINNLFRIIRETISVLSDPVRKVDNEDICKMLKSKGKEIDKLVKDAKKISSRKGGEK